MLPSHKEGNPSIYNYTDELVGTYARWNKPDRGRQTLYDPSDTWNLKKENSQKQRAEWGLPGTGR